tara:strand:- start:592 stop:1167 length:576 start_codon:yes stop_codon:yes gene_type:complete
VTLDQAHDLSPGLLRQRRNLTLTSAALLFLSFAEAEIHSFQILGISATFGRPEAVVVGLTAMAFYFLYRYALYLRQEPAFGLRSEFFSRLNRYAKPKILNLRDHKYPAGKGLELAEELGVRKASKLSWTILVGSQQDGAGGYMTNDLVVPLKEVWWEAVKASLMAVVARSYFTDYVFPFLLAAVALFVTFR